MEDLLQIQEPANITATELQDLLSELDRLKARVRELESPTFESHWKDAKGNWIPYPSIEPRHLINILGRIDLNKNVRAREVKTEVNRRWGDIVITLEFAERLVCSQINSWVKYRDLGTRCTIADLIPFIECEDKDQVLTVIKNAVIAQGRWR